MKTPFLQKIQQKMHTLNRAVCDVLMHKHASQSKPRIKLKKWVKKILMTGKQRVTTLGLVFVYYFFIFGINIAHGRRLGRLSNITTNSLSSTAQGTGILMLIATIPGAMLFISAGLFDTTISWTIANVGTLLGNGSTESLLWAIKIIWQTVRDIANILIIGMFVFIAISTILGQKKYSFKQLIVRLLTVAILINFSFFFTQVAIDISNWFSVQIYNSIMPDPSTLTTSSFSLSENLMQKFGMGTIMGAWMTVLASMAKLDTAKEVVGIAGYFGARAVGIAGAIAIIATSPITTILYIVITTILFLLLAILFLRFSFILIARFIILLILMATSGAAFVAMVIPSLKPWWEMWRKALVANIILAPALLLTVWAVDIISTAVQNINDFGNTALNGGYATQFGDLRALMDGLTGLYNMAGGNVQTPFGQFGAVFTSLLYLAIMIGLLWAAIRIATMLSDHAAKSAGDIGKYISNALGRVEGLGYKGAFGSIGWAGRNTFGKGFASMGDAFDMRAAKSASRMGRALYGSLGKGFGALGKKGYDPRALKGLSKEMAKMGMTHTGKAVKDGFAKIAEQKAKREEELKEKYKKKIEEETRKNLATEADIQRKNAEEQENLRKQEEELRQQQKEIQEQLNETSTNNEVLSNQRADNEAQARDLNEKAATANAKKEKLKEERATVEQAVQDAASKLKTQGVKIDHAKLQAAIDNDNQEEVLNMLDNLIKKVDSELDGEENKESDEYKDKQSHLQTLKQQRKRYDELSQGISNQEKIWKDADTKARSLLEANKAIGETLEQNQNKIQELEDKKEELKKAQMANVQAQKTAMEVAQLEKEMFDKKIEEAANKLTAIMKFTKPKDEIDINKLQDEKLGILKSLNDENNTMSSALRAERLAKLNNINEQIAQIARYEKERNTMIKNLRKQALLTEDELKTRAEQKRIVKQLEELLKPSQPQVDSAQMHNARNAVATEKVDNMPSGATTNE